MADNHSGLLYCMCSFKVPKMLAASLTATWAATAAMHAQQRFALTYLLRLDLAGDAIGRLPDALQVLAKADGVLAGGCASPVQQQGQQLVLGQVGNRLRSQGMHAGPRLSLDKNDNN